MAKSKQQMFLDGFGPEPASETPPGQGHTAGTSAAADQLRLEAPAGQSGTATRSATDEVRYSLDGADMPEDLAGETIVLVDSHSLIYQVFHAVAPMSSPSGIPVAAVYGFLRDVADLGDRWQPAFIWCAFDLSEITFRNEMYAEYKAHREPMPDELRIQIPLIRDALKRLGVGVAEAPGFEADDIIATLSCQIQQAGGRCIIVTSDKDCRQLINDRVLLYNIRKQELFDAPKLKEVWGIRPDQVVDFQAMVGDSVDNVPGIPLIGPKIAQQLLEQFDTLDKVLENPDAAGGKKRAENIRNSRDKAMLSRELVRLRCDVPLDLDWRDANYSRRDNAELQAMFNEFGFRRLADRLIPPSQTQAVAPTEWVTSYTLVDSVEKLDWLAAQLAKAQLISLDTETTSTNPRWADPVGLSFSWDIGSAAYVPLKAPAGSPVLEVLAVCEKLRPILADPAIPKTGQNIKYDYIVLREMGLTIAGLAGDTMVADYLIDPGQRDHSLDDLAKRRLQHKTIQISELIGTGRDQITMDQVELQKITNYACQDADIPWRLFDPLNEELCQSGLKKLYDEVEIPLVEVLADMEFHGICVDVERLNSLSEGFKGRIDALQAAIVELAGEPFNLDSPKQLQAILYDKLKLPVLKKTQTGASTDAEVLQQLAVYHGLPALLLEYRQLAKLKSTYIEALPQLVCPKTGRVHTSFRQDVAATGRLSSTEPNLQNIPVRTEEGRQIRSAFRAGVPGWILVAADYSQIELRVLAHYCEDTNLRDAFLHDRDVHTQVASEVYGVTLEQVTSAQRRSAKAINFGIIYGQSPFGLAKSLQISKGEAAEFIDAYFARFPGVRQFIEDTIMTCRRQGYVSTMLERRRRVKGVRDFASLNDARKRVMIEPERIAVNTVIQGSAADLIKLAMLRIHRRLQNSPLRAKMLLQIHDELIFEVDRDDAGALAELVRAEMAAVAKLSVPLKVDVKSGENWAECEPI